MPSTILPIDWRPIRHVILDFGGVLYRIDHRATASAFHALGFERFESLYDHGKQSGLMDDLECGIATEDEFLLALRNRCREGTSIAEVKDAWNAVLTRLRPEVLPLIKKLASRFDLLLFSNTNALHAAHFEQPNPEGTWAAFGQPSARSSTATDSVIANPTQGLPRGRTPISVSHRKRPCSLTTQK